MTTIANPKEITMQPIIITDPAPSPLTRILGEHGPEWDSADGLRLTVFPDGGMSFDRRPEAGPAAFAELPASRVSLLERIAGLHSGLRCPTFCDASGEDWIRTALHGDADQLAKLSDLLAEYDERPAPAA